MPLIFRSMAREGDLPLVAPSATALGVRAAPHLCHEKRCHYDVHPDANRVISPMSAAHPDQRKARIEGMSVAPGWERLPPHRIPQRLQHLAKGARGDDKLCCWEMGSGAFENAALGAGLRLHPDEGKEKPNHGVIAPAAPVHVDRFQLHLAATRGDWKIIPEDPWR